MDKQFQNGRHQFLQCISLAIAVTVFAGAQTLQAKSNRTIQGSVHSGSTETAIPLPGAVVNLYQATNDAPRLLGTVTTDATGNFSIMSKPGHGSDGIFYVTADLSSGLQLVSIVGESLSDFVTINELTTVAAGYDGSIHE